MKKYLLILTCLIFILSCTEKSSYNGTFYDKKTYYLNDYLSSSSLLKDSIKAFGNLKLNTLITNIETQTFNTIDSIKAYETILLIATGNENIDIDSLKYAYHLKDLKNLKNQEIPTKVLLGNFSEPSSWPISKLGQEIQSYYDFIDYSTKNYNVILPISFGTYITDKEYLSRGQLIPWAGYLFDHIELYKALAELKTLEVEIATAYYLTLKTILKTEEKKSEKELIILLEKRNCDRVLYTKTPTYNNLISSNKEIKFSSRSLSNNLEILRHMEETKFKNLDSINYKINNDTLYLNNLYTYFTSYPNFAYIREFEGKYQLQLANLIDSDDYHIVNGKAEQKDDEPSVGVAAEIILEFEINLKKVNSDKLIFKEREIKLNK